jgi:hypothetical protein
LAFHYFGDVFQVLWHRCPNFSHKRFQFRPMLAADAVRHLRQKSYARPFFTTAASGCLILDTRQVNLPKLM